MNSRLPATAAVLSTSRTIYQSPADDRAFFSMMAVAVTGTIVVGFSSSYFLPAVRMAPPLPLFVRVHATLFTLWLGLYVAQTALIAGGRGDIHRIVGKAGALLAALMLIVGVRTAIVAAIRGYRGVPGQLFPDSESFLLVSLRDILTFSLLVAAGLYWRTNAAAHKRLMQIAVVGGLLPPGAARLPLVKSVPPLIGVVILLFLLAGPGYDLIRYRRVHPAYVWAGLFSALTLVPLLEPLALTATWHGVARWLMASY